ncbi:MAG: hypothetical protein ACMUJM_18930 [bacterium]
MSRSYYCLLYHIRALLLTKEFEPKSYEGALRLFGLHFIKQGIFEPNDSHIFSKLMKYREEDFVNFQKEANALSLKIKAYLKNKEYF